MSTPTRPQKWTCFLCGQVGAGGADGLQYHLDTQHGEQEE